MSNRRLRAPLRRPLFRRLAATYLLNELGDWMGLIALSVLVFDRTGSAMATAVLFVGTRFLPALLAPPFVARVEQPAPRYALPLIYCGEAAAFGLLALLAKNFSLAAVVVVATVDGVLALAGRSLTRAVVASLLEPSGELRAGNALLNVAFTGGAAVGPAVAGLVVAGFDVPTALLLDALSFLLIALIVVTAGPLPRAEPEPGRTRERLRAGLAYIRGRRLLAAVLTAQGAAFVFFAAVTPIEVIYAKETLGAGDSGYGVLLAAWGVGMVAGSLLFARLRGAPLLFLLLASTAGVGVGYLGMAAAPTLALACAAAVVGGVGNGVQWVAAISAVQELTAPTMQARVMSVLESIGSAMPGIGYLLGGMLAAAWNPRVTFVVAGGGVLLTALVASFALRSGLPERTNHAEPNLLDEADDAVLEWLPGAAANEPFDDRGGLN